MKKRIEKLFKQNIFWIILIAILIVVISYLHYTTPTHKHHAHLIYMQAYFIPILIAAFMFGTMGGIISALAVSAIYLPHVMFQWGGATMDNLLRFMQIGLFNIIGLITGYKTSREKYEKEKLFHTSLQLEKSLTEISQQTEIVSQLKEQLHQTDRLAIIGELTASLAHEVRNPLGSILGITQILKDELKISGKQKEFLEILQNETHRLNLVVENYLNFAKKRKSSKTEFDVKKIILDVILLLNSKIKKKNILLKTNLPESPCFIFGNLVHLQQIMVNIALNGIQAITSNGELIISLLNENNSHILRFKDNGIGLAKNQIKEIFKPFYTQKENGTGLGLSIVKRLVEENSWQIKVTSQVGKGSEFEIIIPN